MLAKNPYGQWDKTCTTHVVPFSVGEYTFEEKKNRRCASLFWISTGRYRSVLGGAGSGKGFAGWYLVVVSQYGAELVDT